MLTGAAVVVVDIFKVGTAHFVFGVVELVNALEARYLVIGVEVGPVSGDSGEKYRTRRDGGNYVEAGESGDPEQRSLFAGSSALKV